jgi:hypothetical protein
LVQQGGEDAIVVSGKQESVHPTPVALMDVVKPQFAFPPPDVPECVVEKILHCRSETVAVAANRRSRNENDADGNTFGIINGCHLGPEREPLRKTLLKLFSASYLYGGEAVRSARAVEFDRPVVGEGVE